MLRCPEFTPEFSRARVRVLVSITECWATPEFMRAPLETLQSTASRAPPLRGYAEDIVLHATRSRFVRNTSVRQPVRARDSFEPATNAARNLHTFEAAPGA